MEEWNGKITGTKIEREDHGIPTCWVSVEGNGCGVSFGGYDLRHYGSDMLMKIIEAVGAHSWESLKGLNCRIRSDGLGSTAKAIGHIVEDRWYEPRQGGK
jgi:hypothetical protein